VWLGKIHEKDIIRSAIGCLQESTRATRLLETCAQEEDLPMYYDHHSICERMKITPAKIDDIVERLRSAGHRASRTHFSGLGLKTDASLLEIERVAKST
jgi:tRNA (guanine26-N2/guanine27-N2)-dimethyltransferase